MVISMKRILCKVLRSIPLVCLRGALMKKKPTHWVLYIQKTHTLQSASSREKYIMQFHILDFDLITDVSKAGYVIVDTQHFINTIYYYYCSAVVVFNCVGRLAGWR